MLKAKWVSVCALSLVGVILALTPAGPAPAEDAQSSSATAYLPTPRPSETCDTCEPNDSLSKACGPLAPGTDYRYPIRCMTPLDDDLYYVDVASAGNVVLDLKNLPSGVNYNVYLYDNRSNLICRGDRPAYADKHVVCSVSQSGRYYVRVYPYPLTGCSNSNPYTLRVTYPPVTPPPVPTSTPPPPCNVHIDDFGDTNSNNDLALPSTWTRTPSGCGRFDAVYNGFDLKLDYDLPPQCTGRYTIMLTPNASPYEALAFKLRGADPQDVLDAVVGLTDLSGQTMKVKVADWLSRVVTDTLHNVTVPLEVFATKVNKAQLSSWFVEFSDSQGVVYFDSIRLERPRVPLVVDNFNDQAHPNALGGQLSTFVSPSATITTTYAIAGAYDASRAGYSISYTAPLYEYAVWETDVTGLDVSSYDFLSFYIKGARGGELVNLYLDDGKIRRFVDVGAYTTVSTTWGLVRAPLKDFQSVNLKDIQKIQLAFEYAPMAGTIYIDDLRFEADPLLIDSFCDSDPDNSVGAEMGIFTSNPACPAVITPTLEAGALRLNYDVTAGSGCYSGYFSRTPLDLNTYRSLSFKVRGERCGAVAAISSRTIPIPTDKLKLGDYLRDGITDEWQEVKIPLAAHTVVADWTRGDSYVIAFEAGRGASKGVTWWDDVNFEAGCEPLWIDNFNDEDHQNALVGASSVFMGGGATASMTLPITQSYGDAGAGLAFRYNVPVGAYASWQTDLRNVNLSGYWSLAFSVRSSSGGANPNIYLEDSTGKRGFVNLERYVSLTTAWQTVSVPLRDFGVDLTQVKSLQVVFEYEPTPVQGTLFLDDIYFGCRHDIYLPIVTKASVSSLSGAASLSAPAIEAASSTGYTWDFESGAQGWTHQTYTNSQAIIAVEPSKFRSYSGAGSLALVMDLTGGDTKRSRGETYVDLSNSPPPSITIPVNLACKPVTCRVYIPTCALGDPNAPNQIQFFVKDAAGKSEYGSPMQVVRNQWFEVALHPSTVTPYNGSMEQGFNPAAIDQVGVRFMAGSSQTRYRGKVYLDVCKWQEIDPSGAASATMCAP